MGAEPAAGQARVEHVIVLVLENRSFDHLLGFLDHPSGDFDGVGRRAGTGNYLRPRDTKGTWYPATDTGGYTLPVDPDHEHYAVMGQVAAIGKRTNTGFVASYVHKALDVARGENRRAMLHTWARRLIVAAVLAAVVLIAAGWVWVAVAAAVAVGMSVGYFSTCARPVTAEQERKAEAVAGAIMAGFPESKVPVLSTLAKEFVLCQRWFCSVPGETWPNRNFFHAATSSGSTDIELGFYHDRTIFETLDDAGSSWNVYYGQFPPQVFFFPYVLARAIDSSGSLKDLLGDIDHERLPAYSFVEPHHGLLGKRPSCSQHPGNNVEGKGDGSDFRAGERLVAEIYEHLRARPALFERTVFVVTYDEHGGTYDHCRPPTTVAPESEHDTLSRRLMRWLTARSYPFGFDFRRLGPRVRVRRRVSLDLTGNARLRRAGPRDRPRDVAAPLRERRETADPPRSSRTDDRAPPRPAGATRSRLASRSHRRGAEPRQPAALRRRAARPTARASRIALRLAARRPHACHPRRHGRAGGPRSREDQGETRRRTGRRRRRRVLRRRRVGLSRKRELRAMAPDELRSLLDETEFWLGALAAERTRNL